MINYELMYMKLLFTSLKNKKKPKKQNKTQRKHAACQPAAMRVKTPYENPLSVHTKNFGITFLFSSFCVEQF